MKKKKTFAAPAPAVVSTTASTNSQNSTNSLVISLPEHPGSIRKLNFTPWIGQGIDAWAHACAAQMQVFLQGKSVTTSTVAAYWNAGVRSFFTYLIAIKGPSTPALLTPQDIRGFLVWLSESGGSIGNQKNIYSHAKSVLVALVQRNLIPKHDDLFPANPFPGSNSLLKGQAPLSNSERIRLASALRDDLIAIHKRKFKGPQSQALAVILLAVAIRCGANTVPLLEAKRDCIQDHPFIPNMKRLVLFKRRGNATMVASLRYSEEHDSSVAVPMDGVALIQMALAYSEPLLNEAKPEHRDRLWLYRTNELIRKDGKRVTPLTAARLTYGVAALVQRHDLRGDDGEPLRLNLSRLRKTVEMRLFDLSGGDLIATAALMGHDPKVADTHYLACTQQMRENATFVGEALPDLYRSSGLGDKVISILPEATPAGRCKNPYGGQRAPKDGTPCDDFFACFACTSYAITGSPDDLHRLFSFYYFLKREMHHAKSEEWRKEFRHTMLLIDRFTADKFDTVSVAAARDRALIAPIGFWAAYTLSVSDNG